MIDKIIAPRAVKAGDLLERGLILRSYHEQQRGLGLLLLGNWKHVLKGTFSLRHNYIISVVLEGSLCCCVLQNTELYNLYKFQCCTFLPQFPLKLIFKGREREGKEEIVEYIIEATTTGHMFVRPLTSFKKTTEYTLLASCLQLWNLSNSTLLLLIEDSNFRKKIFFSWSVEKLLRKISTGRIGWHCNLCLPGRKKDNSSVDWVVNLKDILDFLETTLD